MVVGKSRKSILASTYNNLKNDFTFFKNNIEECYNCLWGCNGNVIRNADRLETLKS